MRYTLSVSVLPPTVKSKLKGSREGRIYRRSTHHSAQNKRTGKRAVNRHHLSQTTDIPDYNKSWFEVTPPTRNPQPHTQTQPHNPTTNLTAMRIIGSGWLKNLTASVYSGKSRVVSLKKNWAAGIENEVGKEFRASSRKYGV